METDGEVKTRKVKKQVRKGDLPLWAGTTSLDQATVDKLHEKEGSMNAEDKLVQDTEHKKNELEEMIYSTRGKLDEVYLEFSSEEERETVRSKLMEVEVSCQWSTTIYDGR